MTSKDINNHNATGALFDKIAPRSEAPMSAAAYALRKSVTNTYADIRKEEMAIISDDTVLSCAFNCISRLKAATALSTELLSEMNRAFEKLALHAFDLRSTRKIAPISTVDINECLVNTEALITPNTAEYLDLYNYSVRCVFGQFEKPWDEFTEYFIGKREVFVDLEQFIQGTNISNDDAVTETVKRLFETTDGTVVHPYINFVNIARFAFSKARNVRPYKYTQEPVSADIVENKQAKVDLMSVNWGDVLGNAGRIGISGDTVDSMTIKVIDGKHLLKEVIDVLNDTKYTKRHRIETATEMLNKLMGHWK